MQATYTLGKRCGNIDGNANKRVRDVIVVMIFSKVLQKSLQVSSRLELKNSILHQHLSSQKPKKEAQALCLQLPVQLHGGLHDLGQYHPHRRRRVFF